MAEVQADCPDNDSDNYVVYDGVCTIPDGKLSGDCNDNDPLINPGAIELCGDGVDNNCNGEVDEGFVVGGKVRLRPAMTVPMAPTTTAMVMWTTRTHSAEDDCVQSRSVRQFTARMHLPAGVGRLCLDQFLCPVLNRPPEHLLSST